MSNNYEGRRHYRKGKRKWHNCKQNTNQKLKKEHHFTSEQNNCSSNSQRRDDSQGAEEDLEIPGFYYDKEKKKYFRILPGQNGMVSGIITEEVLQKKCVEERRQKDLNFYSKRPLTLTSKLTGKKPSCLISDNSYHINTARSIGLRSPLLAKSVLRECYIKRLTQRAKIALVALDEWDVYSNTVEDVKKMIISPDATSLVCQWSVKDLMLQPLQRFHIKPTKRIDAEGNVALKMKMCFSAPQVGTIKIMSLCWAPSPEEVDCTSRILFTSTSLLENTGNVACLINLDSAAGGSRRLYSLSQASWSCAWSATGAQFAVGLETHCLLVDVETKKMSKFYNDNSTIYTMAIPKQSSRTVYSGTRKGNIFIHDLRSHFARCSSDIYHKFGIAHIYVAADGLSLTASDVSGMIKTWDLRQRKVIREFPGHINQYVRQPFVVDANENFLFAAGQDCYTRIWNYQTGNLIHTIPSPHPVSVHSIPQIAYSDHIGGPLGLPGLLLTSKGEFHFYSF